MKRLKRKNFIVVVETVERKRKGRVILKINEIETLYAKKEKGIIMGQRINLVGGLALSRVIWILNYKIANVDKKKALHWIEELQPHAETEQSKKELLDAAKIIKDFEITKLSNGKSREQRKISDTPEEKEKTGLILLQMVQIVKRLKHVKFYIFRHISVFFRLNQIQLIVYYICNYWCPLKMNNR